MKKIPIAIFASGRGSNFDSIVEAAQSGKLAAEIVALVSDQIDAPVLTKAGKLGIPTIVVPFPKSGDLLARREAHEKEILKALQKPSPQFLVMAGYMRILSPVLIEAFRSPRGYARIVNIHPSLLPSFPGIHSYAQAFDFGAKIAGVTVHLVDQKVDSGPICAQESFSIADCRSAEEVEAGGLKIEHRLFSETLNWVLPEKFEVENISGRIRVRPN